MFKFIILASMCALVLASPIAPGSSELELQQNKNAKYEFFTDIEDHINDLVIKRDEVRDGLNIKGSYTYSDGYVKRIVHYVADENGYRIVGEEQVLLDGPKVDDHGTATILHNAHGQELKYSVKSVPLEHEKKL